MSKSSRDGASESEEEEASGPASNSESHESPKNNSDNEDNASVKSKDISKSGSGTSESESQSQSESSSESDDDEEDEEEDEGQESGNNDSGSNSDNASESNKEGSGSEDEEKQDEDEQEDDDGDDDEEDEEEDEEESDDKAISSLNTSRASSRSKSSSSSGRSSRSNLKQNPDIYGIRRSNRERKQPERIAIQQNQKTKRKKRKKSPQWHSSEASFSEESDSDRGSYARKKPTAKKKKPTKKYRPSSDSEDSETCKPKRTSRGVAAKVSYKEDSEDEDEEDEDLVEVDWGAQPLVEENIHTIEKIMSHRKGKKGAVGMQTYKYEVEKNGDPNSSFDHNDPEQTEMQYLIKWKGWAHIHNTWESEESLKTQKVKGGKKLENYLRKEEEMQLWRNRATPEEIEYMEIQAVLERDLHASHLFAERVFAEALENENTYFYIKWQNLPYSEATWELEDFVKNRFSDKLEKFREREESEQCPKQCPVLKHRPKFSPLKMQPDFVGGENEDLQLRDYQMDGLNWLIHSWCKHNSVILADEMGLGKTIQTIAFLSYLFHIHNLYGPFLLVLPLSTLNAWQREFSQWAPEMNVIVYIGDRDSRRIIHDYEWKYDSKHIKFNAVLTTYEILLRDKEVLQDTCQWAVLIIDEAHRLKNEESQLYQALREFKTNHRLLITGTPLQNSLKELWALLHFIMPDRFDDWEHFESQHDGDKKKGFHRLHRQLEPFLLRRVKKDVEKSLPAKVEQILRVDMTQLQKQYYKWILTKNYDMLRKGNRGSTSSFVNIVMELKKCCNHAFLTKTNEEPCSGASEIVQQLLRGSGKLMLLDKLLVRLNETGHRVLIFSQMVRMLDILAQYLQTRRFTFQRIDGSISGELRRQALDHFNAEGSSDFCFLLSTRAGGLGINLATADTVIIFDSDWNPQNDLQAQARAHRIGQKNQVNIYRLVTKNSIEETIIERAKQKMVLDHLVIQSMDTSGRTVFNKKMPSTSSTPFNKEELNAILKFGAEELFKDDEENEEEPMCDIDEILRRAETRDEGPSSAGEDLLSAFKVASFNLDEEEDVSKLDSVADENTRDWDEIIPENIRAQVTEEERKKEMADLYLPPRKRKTLNQEEKENSASPMKKVKRDSESSGEEESDEDKPRRRGRPRVYHKETVKGFTDAEVRRFFKSMKKFSNPLRRLDTIAIDADMREKSIEDLRLLAAQILDRCKEAIREHERERDGEKTQELNGGQRKRRDRGPSFRLSSVAINAKTTLGILEELEPLDRVVPHAPVERASWSLPIKRVKDAHWDVPWGIQEDSRLLRGIYEYGMGSYEQIKHDQSLNLGDKILVAELKPQAKHLENRAQYLLKLIKKTQGLLPSKARGPKPKLKRAKETKGLSKEIIENDDSTDEDAANPPSASFTAKKTSKEAAKEDKRHQKEVKVEVKEEEKEKDAEKKQKVEEHRDKAKKKKKEKERREKAKGPVHITANGKPMPVDSAMELDQNHPQWPECKEKMRPMKKALKALDNPNKSVSQEEQIQHTRKCLIQIGDHIEKTLQQYTDHDTYKEWKNLLWQFVSKFTEYDAKKLHKLYKKHKKLVEEKGESRIKIKDEKVKEEKSKEEKKEHHHKKDKEKHKKDKKKEERHHHKRRNEEEQNQQSQKKPYNGWSTDRNRDESRRPDKGRERDPRDQERSRDRDRNYQRSWHNTPNRDYNKESRYPQDFKREGGYHRDNFKTHGYWGGRPHPQKYTGYGAPGGSYNQPRHYPPTSYGLMPNVPRMPLLPGGPFGVAPQWQGKGRIERHDWAKEPVGDRPLPGNPDWVKKGPRQDSRPERQQF